MGKLLLMTAVFCGLALHSANHAVAQSAAELNSKLSITEEWIVLGTDAAQSLTNNLASKFIDGEGSPHFAINTQENGLTIARIGPT